MSRYGQIRECNSTAADFRVSLFFQSTISQQLGNGGIPTNLQEFLTKNRDKVEDVFSGNDSVYILPKDKDFARALYKECVGPLDKHGEYIEPVADEIDWNKIENRYWLGLWWD